MFKITSMFGRPNNKPINLEIDNLENAGPAKRIKELLSGSKMQESLSVLLSTGAVVIAAMLPAKQAEAQEVSKVDTGATATATSDVNTSVFDSTEIKIVNSNVKQVNQSAQWGDPIVSSDASNHTPEEVNEMKDSAARYHDLIKEIETGAQDLAMDANFQDFMLDQVNSVPPEVVKEAQAIDKDFTEANPEAAPVERALSSPEPLKLLLNTYKFGKADTPTIDITRHDAGYSMSNIVVDPRIQDIAKRIEATRFLRQGSANFDLITTLDRKETVWTAPDPKKAWGPNNDYKYATMHTRIVTPVPKVNPPTVDTVGNIHALTEAIGVPLGREFTRYLSGVTGLPYNYFETKATIVGSVHPFDKNNSFANFHPTLEINACNKPAVKEGKEWCPQVRFFTNSDGPSNPSLKGAGLFSNTSDYTSYLTGKKLEGTASSYSNTYFAQGAKRFNITVGAVKSMPIIDGVNLDLETGVIYGYRKLSPFATLSISHPSTGTRITFMPREEPRLVKDTSTTSNSSPNPHTEHVRKGFNLAFHFLIEKKF